MAQHIAILDYGMGNLHSIAKAFEHVAPDAHVQITDRAADLHAADRVVFPGQGAIGQCMQRLQTQGLDRLLAELIAQKPVLGVCLGLQAVVAHSEENGGTECLGLLPGTVERFPAGIAETPGSRAIRIPHMGWNTVRPTQDHPVWAGLAPDERFYFVHSYHVAAGHPAIAGQTHYGVDFASALAHGNLFAVQFHPEKSQHAGLRLLRNFVAWQGA